MNTLWESKHLNYLIQITGIDKDLTNKFKWNDVAEKFIKKFGIQYKEDEYLEKKGELKKILTNKLSKYKKKENAYQSEKELELMKQQLERLKAENLTLKK